MKHIFAIVVTFRGKKWYNRCFGSLVHSEIPIDIIAVDNASKDGSVEYIENNFPKVIMLAQEDNLGFARANNIGIRYALDHGADYVFLLNQDAWIENNTLTELLHTFDDNGCVGVASPIHLNGSYTALDVNFAGYMRWEFVSDAYLQKMKHYYEVPFVNAAAWLISEKCLRKVGGFDTLLFKHYGEDNNYLQRVQYHGMKVLVNTCCTICHDREKRTVKPQDLSFNANLEYYLNKVEKGNIQQQVDVFKEISDRKRNLWKAYLGLHPKRIKRLKREILLLQDIELSRKYNIQGGEVWL